jgi:DNA-binding IclR family transcriptional regulator
MNSPWFKLIGSSIWDAPYHVRIAWITLMAMSGRDAVAPVSAAGLARLANIPPEKAADALAALSSNGWIERVPIGWKLLRIDT